MGESEVSDQIVEVAVSVSDFARECPEFTFSSLVDLRSKRYCHKLIRDIEFFTVQYCFHERLLFL